MNDKSVEMVVFDHETRQMRPYKTDTDSVALANMGMWGYTLNMWNTSSLLGELTKTFTAGWSEQQQIWNRSVISSAVEGDIGAIDTLPGSYHVKRFEEAKRSQNWLPFKKAATIMEFYYDEERRLVVMMGWRATTANNNDIVAADRFLYRWLYPNTPTTKPIPDEVHYLSSKYYRQGEHGIVPLLAAPPRQMAEPRNGWVNGQSLYYVQNVAVLRSPEAGEVVPPGKVINSELYGVVNTYPEGILAD